ncbi:unnamed protein product [Discosporangium mesarthrocarpum]
MADYAPADVATAWDNHFSAFGAQDVDKILLDYDDKSKITTWNLNGDEKAVYEGVDGARTLFEGLFKNLSDLSELGAPLIDVDEETKMVFLVWRCPSSGVVDATDTFTFTDDFKILRQNVVFKTA